MAEARDITIRLTNGATVANAETSLGGDITGGGVLRQAAGQVSAGGTPYAFTASALIGSGIQAGWWVNVIQGPNAGHAAPIRTFDNATGRFVLERVAPANFSTSDWFNVHAPNELWAPIAAPPEDPILQYRGLCVVNFAGERLFATRLYHRILSGGNAELRAAITNDDTAGQTSMDLIADETERPDLEGDLNEAAIVQRDLEVPPVDEALAESPPVGTRELDQGDRYPMWVARFSPVISPPRPTVAVQLILRWSNTGGDPDPLFLPWLFVWDEAGYAPELAFAPDRQLRVGGGARFQVKAVVAGTEIPIPGADVNYELVSGPGTLAPRDEIARRTDQRGRSFVSYDAGAATAGQSVTVRAEVS